MQQSLERWLIAILFLLLWLAVWHIGGLEIQRDSFRSLADHQVAELVTWRNKYDEARAERQSVLADRDILKKQYREKLDSLEKHFDMKMKKMQSITSIGTVTARKIDQIPVVELNIDSLLELSLDQVEAIDVNDQLLYAEAFHFQDKWLTLDGLLLKKSSGKTLSIVYTSRDSLSLVTSWKKKGWKFWQPSLLYVDAVHYNPFATFSGLEHIEVKAKPQRFGIGPFVGITPKGWSYGVSLQYSVIEF